MFFWCRGWIGPHTLYPLKALIPISTICKACVEIRFSLYSQRPKAVRCQKAASWQWLYQTGQIFSRSEGRDIFFGWQQEYTKEPTCFLVASPPLAHHLPPSTPPPHQPSSPSPVCLLQCGLHQCLILFTDNTFTCNVGLQIKRRSSEMNLAPVIKQSS